MCLLTAEDLPDIPAVLAGDNVYSDPRTLMTFLGLHDMRRFREKGSHEAMKSAFQLVLTSRGTPLIYYGDEIGMKGAGDPDNRRDFPGDGRTITAMLSLPMADLRRNRTCSHTCKSCFGCARPTQCCGAGNS
jgi:glycosidase